MSLTKFYTTDKDLSLLQTSWASDINPVLNAPLNNGHILSGVVLSSGTNSVNHLLARKLLGWFIVRQRSAASIYDNQDSNSNPTQTLTLVSSAGVTVDLFVF